jgi:hypothetical protein
LGAFVDGAIYDIVFVPVVHEGVCTAPCVVIQITLEFVVARWLEIGIPPDNHVLVAGPVKFRIPANRSLAELLGCLNMVVDAINREDTLKDGPTPIALDVNPSPAYMLPFRLPFLLDEALAPKYPVLPPIDRRGFAY